MSGITRLATEFSYSAAVSTGDTVYLGLHRGFGDTFAEQLDSAIAEFDLTLASIVKINVWLLRIDDLTEMEHRFRRYFPDGGFPARMTATTEFVDDDCLLQLEGVARKS